MISEGRHAAENEGIQVCVTEHVLDISRSIEWVRDDGCGAISTFIGTTRNIFEGKIVLQLEYEAYTPMALKKLKEICETAKSRWDIRRISIMHRIGIVPVKEASVVIAVSSPHRKDSLEVRFFFMLNPILKEVT